jgi:hypothetical protein
MTINTVFSIGNPAWVIRGHEPVQVTVGQVRVKIEDQKSVEEYMAKETGIGSGTIYTSGRDIFKDKSDCELAIEQRKAKALRYGVKGALEKILSETINNMYDLMTELSEKAESTVKLEATAATELRELVKAKWELMLHNRDEVSLLDKL